jgi:hypothetical protein
MLFCLCSKSFDKLQDDPRPVVTLSANYFQSSSLSMTLFKQLERGHNHVSLTAILLVNPLCVSAPLRLFYFFFAAEARRRRVATADYKLFSIGFFENVFFKTV